MGEGSRRPSSSCSTGRASPGACSRWRRADRSTALLPVRHSFGRHGGWFEHRPSAILAGIALGLTLAGCEIGFVDRGGSFVADNRSDVAVVARIKSTVRSDTGAEIAYKVVELPASSRMVIATQGFADVEEINGIEVLLETCESLGTFWFLTGRAGHPHRRRTHGHAGARMARRHRATGQPGGQVPGRGGVAIALSERPRVVGSRDGARRRLRSGDRVIGIDVITESRDVVQGFASIDPDLGRDRNS